MTDTKETRALEQIKYIKELLRMARFHDSVREGVTLASPSKNAINSYLHKIEKTIQSQNQTHDALIKKLAEKDRVYDMMVEALGAVKSIYGESLKEHVGKSIDDKVSNALAEHEKLKEK